MNGRGEQVGIVFDGNYEGIGNDFFYNEAKGRTIAVDTTTASPGAASKTVTLTTTTGLDSVAVIVSANNLRGQSLKGSPRRFVIPVKKGS